MHRLVGLPRGAPPPARMLFSADAEHGAHGPPARPRLLQLHERPAADVVGGAARAAAAAPVVAVPAAAPAALALPPSLLTSPDPSGMPVGLALEKDGCRVSGLGPAAASPPDAVVGRRVGGGGCSAVEVRRRWDLGQPAGLGSRSARAARCCCPAGRRRSGVDAASGRLLGLREARRGAGAVLAGQQRGRDLLVKGFLADLIMRVGDGTGLGVVARRPTSSPDTRSTEESAPRLPARVAA